MKYVKQTATGERRQVAPHWGAWIEIPLWYDGEYHYDGRTPLGCVD